MKVAILAGGFGTRLGEETEVKPKPMVEIGGRPVLWHIMGHYSHYNHNDFYIALGYRGEYIKRYMQEMLSLHGDMTVDFESGTVSRGEQMTSQWRVNLIETGGLTLTGGRIKRLQRHLGDETFMLTWGDGVSDVDLDKLMAFHRAHGKLATVTAVRPPARYGHLEIEDDRITEFSEKPQAAEGWINGAFFVLEPGVFDYIEGDSVMFEHAPMRQLAADGQLMAYQHEGFWQCMDTRRDRQILEDIWASGKAHGDSGEASGKGDSHMRVLVTGHLGYIGTVLTPMLIDRGHEVVGLDTDLYRRCTYGDPGRIAEVPNIGKDVRDVEASDLEGFDAVLHLAGLSNDPLGNLNPDLTYAINHRASVRLAELAKAAGASRFVFASSCSNYGAGGQDMLDEEAEFNPVTPYGESKVFVERDVTPMADDRFSPVFLRASTAYGVSPRLRFDLVLNNLVAWAVTTGKIYLKSDGTPWRPIVHIGDIARAYVAVMEAPRKQIHGRAFNVGRTDQNFRIKELAEIVGETVPDCRIDYAPDAGPDKRCYRVSCERLVNEVDGYEPVWDAATGARELYEAYLSENITLEEFEGPRYQRIGHIRYLQETGALTDDLRPVEPADVSSGAPS